MYVSLDIQTPAENVFGPLKYAKTEKIYMILIIIIILFIFLLLYIYIYMTSIFEGQPPKNKAQTSIKTRGPIWVPGIYPVHRFCPYFVRHQDGITGGPPDRHVTLDSAIRL